MTQGEKKLIIKDLCERLPYGVIVQVNDGLKGIYDSQLVQVFYDRVSCSVSVRNPLRECICIDSVKPYLRPMSSMTEEEAKDIAILHGNNREDILSIKVTDEYIDIILDDGVCGTITSTIWYDEIISSVECLDYLNKKMFDYRGLIPKGLALVAHEGMYENKSDLVGDNTTQITIGCIIRSKINPDEILRIVSNDWRGKKFKCSNGCILSLKQIKEHYDLYIEKNTGTIIIN